MPIYAYKCPTCTGMFEIVKEIDEYARPEQCPCGSQVTRENRVITPFTFYGADDWNTQTYNPGLGCFTRNNSHARKIAKSKGFEEVGNESAESMHKAADDRREQIRNDRWNKDID